MKRQRIIMRGKSEILTVPYEPEPQPEPDPVVQSKLNLNRLHFPSGIKFKSFNFLTPPTGQYILDIDEVWVIFSTDAGTHELHITNLRLVVTTEDGTRASTESTVAYARIIGIDAPFDWEFSGHEMPKEMPEMKTQILEDVCQAMFMVLTDSSLAPAMNVGSRRHKIDVTIERKRNGTKK